MKVSILDAQHVIYEGIAPMVVLPSSDGEASIMDDHEFIFMALTKGSIRLERGTKKEAMKSAAPQEEEEPAEDVTSLFIQQGLARMKNNELVILVE